MAERDMSVDHSTIYKWMQKYAPEIERQLAGTGAGRARGLAGRRDLLKVRGKEARMRKD